MDLVLAVSPFEIAKLDVDVAGLLSPDDGNRLVGRLAIPAMAAGAGLELFSDALRNCPPSAALSQSLRTLACSFGRKSDDVVAALEVDLNVAARANHDVLLAAHRV